MNYPPSMNPASRGDLAGLVRFILTKFLQGTDDMLPAVVKSYDRTTNRAEVQPLIAIIATNNQVMQRGAVASVPVFQMGAGGYVLSFPLKPGDLGWIKANDRDISLFLQSLGNSTPNTGRLHSFENGMFFPDTMFRGVTIDPVDSDSVVLQNLAGTGKVAIDTDGNVTVLAATTAKITAPHVVITASMSITLDSPLTTITGVIASTDAAGTATFAGSIQATGDVSAGTISLKTHVHSGVMPGGGDTGVPVP